MKKYRLFKLSIMLSLVGLPILGYFAWTTFGSTKVNVTLTTNPDLKNGLVGHWTFDGPDLKQNAADSSGQGNTGYLTSFDATTTTRGKLGQALSFDGVDDYVNSGLTTEEIGAITTISLWAKTSTSTTQTLIGARDLGGTNYLYWFSMESTGKLQLYIRSVSIFVGPVNSAKSDDKWHHYVVSYIGGSTTASFYVDGAFVGTGSSNAVTASSNQNRPLFLGAVNAGSSLSGFLNGSLDDVRIYNRALSQEE